jgi:hypothetical protein
MASSPSSMQAMISLCWRNRTADGDTVDQFKQKLKDVQQEEQLGWLTAHR